MMPKPCPNEEYWIDFLEDRLSEPARSRMEHHLAGCQLCREQVRICSQLIHDDNLDAIPTVSPELTRRAEARVARLNAPRQPRRPLPDPRRWAARGKSAWEQFKLWGMPAPVPVRGGDQPVAETLIQRKKQFGDLVVAIELESHHGNRALIRVALDEASRGVEPVRVALFRDGRELASMMLSDAAILFEDIAFGVYALKFIRRGELAGEYTFELTGDSDPQVKH